MVNSMTGFATIQGRDRAYNWTIEIRSVNARGLDIRTRLPEGVEGLEKAVRDRVSAAASRGSVSVTMRISREDQAMSMGADPARIAAALEAIAAVEAAAADRGQRLDPVRATDILGLRGMSDPGRDTIDTGAVLKPLLADFDATIKDFNAMRAAEGAAIGRLLSNQVSAVAELTDAAVAAAGRRTDRMRAALKSALATIVETSDAVDPGRVEAELAMIAVKADVTEEIDRLRTHVGAARDLLKAKGPVGRKLDFLSQEFNREANTLCSKAQSGELTAIGLDLKAVIDQMREQVQNVE